MHQLRLEAGSEQVSVEYAVDLPVHGHGGGEDVQTPAELVAGLLLEVDGARVPLVAGDPIVRRAAERLGVRVRLTAEGLEPGTHELALSNGNYADLPAYTSPSLYVGPGVEVLETSLWTVEEGRIVRDDGGGWVAGDRHRTLTARVRVGSPLRAWLDPEGLRPARSARPGGLPRGLALGAGGLAAMAALVLLVRRRRLAGGETAG